MHSAWSQTGWKISDLGVVLRGGFKGPSSRLFDLSKHSRYALSVYHLSSATYPEYRQFVLKHHPSFLHAYPSSAADLAALVIENDDIGQIAFETIFVGSEHLYDWQKQLIKRAFPNAHLMHWYGHSECAIFAPWCEASERFHVCPFYGHCEVLGLDDKEVGAGVVGELVGSSFWMQATPFIRYRTLDYARKGVDGCKGCGRRFQMLDSVEGRLREMVVSSGGRKIAMASINMHDTTFDEVAQFRFVQDQQGIIELLILPKALYNDSSMEKIHRSIMEKLGEDFILRIRKVERIERLGSGKHSFLDQHLEIDRYDRLEEQL